MPVSADRKSFVRNAPQRPGRPSWTFVGGIQLQPYAAGTRPVVLVQAPVTGNARLTPEQARELARALMSSAAIAEQQADTNARV